MTQAPTRWPATYLDGRTAKEHPTEVWFSADGLVIEGFVVWPYHTIRLAKEARVEAVRLMTREELAQSVTVADPRFELEVRRYYPAIQDNSQGMFPTLRRLALLAAAAVMVLAVLWIWALPAATVASASLVPVSFEERLGQLVVNAMAPPSRLCTDPKVTRPVEDIVGVLEREAPSPYRYRVFVSNDPLVNAFAAPGRFIVVNRGLMEKTKSPEDLAGVLAHEMQHVIQRHSTRAMMRSVGISILTAYLFGDTSGLAGLGAQLGEMAYMRGDEASADREGMLMIQRAQLDPNGIVRLMQILEKEYGNAPKAINYFSTHPNTAERIVEMRKMAGAANYSPRALLPGVKWPPSFASCPSK